MSWKQTIQDFAVQAQISKPLTRRMVALTELLEDYLTKRNKESLKKLATELPEKTANVFEEKNSAENKKLQKIISSLDLDEIVDLLRLNTIFFHLVNSLEQHEIIRINRERALNITPDKPRAESIADALHFFKNKGYSYEEAVTLFKKLDIQPTITAHPTEARRRSILNKQDNITAMISKLENTQLTPTERDCMMHQILNEIALLISTDEVRSERLKVEDEVENGLFYFTHTIWNTIPRLYDDIRYAFELYYGKSPDLPIVLKYRSWIGSDRDGNPNVTTDVTWSTLLEQRKTVFQLYLKELNEIRRYLSISKNLVDVPDALLKSLKKDEKEVPLSDRYKRHYQNEPFRRKITHMMHRIENLKENLRESKHLVMDSAISYNSDDFIADLELLANSLKQSGLGQISTTGRFNDLLIRAKTFRFHMCALDIRQHSGLHEETVTELLKLAKVDNKYHKRTEDEKIRLLIQELKNPRPLVPAGIKLSATAEKILGVFHLLNDIFKLDRHAFGCYIISMTHGVSDLLEVLILAKEAGLWNYNDGDTESMLDVVPLFETIEDLEKSPALMESILSDEVYGSQVKARNQFQEIMLGYSDSNKDGGYWIANWALQKAQHKLGKVLRKREIDFRLFHGRGGSVGRGGGRSNRAILGLPAISNNGRIRFTEQGEIISFRYSLPEITRRHLEQVVNAVVRVTAGEGKKSLDDTDGMEEIMDSLSQVSMDTYRNLIDHPDFWDWYRYVTPVEHIGNLPIASRPVSRGGDKGLQFDNLRAIPWVFAWTQVRYNVPGWYGIGESMQTLLEEKPEAMDILKKWYREWNFFATILDNAQREMARTHILTTEMYAARHSDKTMHEKILDDYHKAEKVILKITEQDNLLDMREVIQNSIKFRNVFTYPLNLLQVELLDRWDEAESDEERLELRRAMFLSINGVAAAMQSTG